MHETICTKLRGMMKVDNERKLKVEAAELAGQAVSAEAAELAGQAVQGKIDDTTVPVKQDESLASDGAAVRAATAENVTITPPPVKTERLLKKRYYARKFYLFGLLHRGFRGDSGKNGRGQHAENYDEHGL